MKIRFAEMIGGQIFFLWRTGNLLFFLLFLEFFLNTEAGYRFCYRIPQWYCSFLNDNNFLFRGF
ncbi:hypothetical protein [Chryseobacterium sp. MFBS3-17]|uniref:hypothetical protein n=1 Tax=Chryseobacterium sp. MFBS3-17 TaxID=2886689 RepID=UPI001D0E95B5|nr:hypothetical protein [Chryseobacterium sp. MFBS3-17]MCC2591528.1 hypothetical protein [Chryseobacterium sp. MFBS3-17]